MALQTTHGSMGSIDERLDQELELLHDRLDEELELSDDRLDDELELLYSELLNDELDILPMLELVPVDGISVTPGGRVPSTVGVDGLEVVGAGVGDMRGDCASTTLTHTATLIPNMTLAFFIAGFIAGLR